MAEAQGTQKTATEMQMAEMDIFKRLTQVGYTANQANGLMNLAKTQLSGKSVTVSSDNPFTRNIQLGDVNNVANALANVKKNPDARQDIVTRLDIKGPEKSLAEQKEAGPIIGFSCAVKIGTHSFTTQLKPSEEGASPVVGKDNERKQQLSELLTNPGNVLQVIERNSVTGNDVAVPISQFINSYQKAFSENPDSVIVKMPKKA